MDPRNLRLELSNSTSITIAASRGRVSDFVELCKLRLSGLVLFTTAVGFYVGQQRALDLASLITLVNTILGTSLVASAAMVLNQYMERGTDAVMQRTMNRPIPSGRISPAEALLFGLALSVIGLACLAVLVNGLVAFLAAVTLTSYLFLYTPLKTRTPLCTLVGAFPGAIPPMIGYAAACGVVDLRALSLFAILFVWQLPHFLAIAWLYRDDYARGGQLMLPVLDPHGVRTAQHIVLLSLMLVPTALLPGVVGITGPFYMLVSMALGIGFFICALRLARVKSRALARQVFFASIIYLPLLLVFLATDRL